MLNTLNDESMAEHTRRPPPAVIVLESTSRGTLPEPDLEPLRRSPLLWGLALQCLIGLSTLAYLRSTESGEHRALLGWLVECCLGLTVGCLLLTRRIARRRRPRRFWFGWMASGSAMMCVLAALDGGLESPLLLTPVLPVMAAALVSTPSGLALCVLVAMSGIVTVGATDPHTTLLTANMMFLLGLLLGAMGLSLLGSWQRTRLQSRLAELTSELRRRASIDDLTGCANHRAFHARLRLEVDRALRYGRPLSLMMCDVDRFKTMNDRFGHAHGDTVLAAVGVRLRSVARSIDLAARLGGDEFAIIMPETTAVQARALAGRVVEGLADADGLSVSMSLGVADLILDDPRPERLLADADAALSDAKRSGRGPGPDARLSVPHSPRI